MERERLFREVERTLKAQNYDLAEVRSTSFDILAKKEEILILKILENIDSITEEQANDIKAFSSLIDGYSFLIGLKNFRSDILDYVIYKRYGIPAMNPRTLRMVLENSARVGIISERGGKYVKINSNNLKEKMIEKKYSRNSLAKKVGVSPRTILNYEKGELATLENATKLEKLLPGVFDHFTLENLKSGGFQPEMKSFISLKLNSLGFNSLDFQKAPFNACAMDEREIYFLKEASACTNLENLKAVRDFLDKLALLIVEKEFESEFPEITKKDFSRMRNREDFINKINS